MKHDERDRIVSLAIDPLEKDFNRIQVKRISAWKKAGKPRKR